MISCVLFNFLFHTVLIFFFSLSMILHCGLFNVIFSPVGITATRRSQMNVDLLEGISKQDVAT